MPNRIAETGRGDQEFLQPLQVLSLGQVIKAAEPEQFQNLFGEVDSLRGANPERHTSIGKAVQYLRDARIQNVLGVTNLTVALAVLCDEAIQRGG